MMDIMYLGPTPPNENCAQVGDPFYHEQATEQCQRYVDLIRKKCGPEPEGARLALYWQSHDYGRYVEVVVHFDPSNEAAADYAYMVEAEGPADWTDSEPD
jgi:hypothetical protein